ncbi:MAG: hypothetical protein WDN04_03660 [Rhodospirillales bacterium]
MAAILPFDGVVSIRCDGVEPDAFRAEFHGERAGKIRGGGFGAGIDRERCRSAMRLDRGEIDDAAAVGAATDQGYRVAYRVDDVAEITPDILRILGRVTLHEGAAAHPAHYVDDDVQTL